MDNDSCFYEKYPTAYFYISWTNSLTRVKTVLATYFYINWINSFDIGYEFSIGSPNNIVYLVNSKNLANWISCDFNSFVQLKHVGFVKFHQHFRDQWTKNKQLLIMKVKEGTWIKVKLESLLVYTAKFKANYVLRTKNLI